MIFFDTSVIVCASHRADSRYEASLEFLSRATPETACCGAHSLAEVYATLTGRPYPMRIPIPSAFKIIEHARSRLTVVALDEGEYFEAVRASAKAGRMGGIIFDALLIACARKAKAETIYTWNMRHFRLIAPDLAAKILEPGT